MNGGAVGALAALAALVGLVLRIAVAADRLDRARTRRRNAQTRAAISRADATHHPYHPPNPARYGPQLPPDYRQPPVTADGEPLRGVGYREPRPPIDSPEALERFRSTTPPGVTVSPPRRVSPDKRFNLTVASLASNERAYAEGRISKLDHDITAARLTKRLGQLARAQRPSPDARRTLSPTL